MNLGDMIWGGLGFLLTVMVLSYLIGDNFFFRLAAHVFIGLTAGYLAVLIVRQILWPYLITPLVTHTWMESLWLAVPLILILLLLLSQIPKVAGLGSIPLAFLIGLTAAIAIGGAVFGTLIPQAKSLVDAFDPAFWHEAGKRPWLRILDSALMLIGIVSTLSFFHFGRKWRIDKNEEMLERPRIFEVLSKVGQIFIGISLGAVFAGIFSSALMALIDRIMFIADFISGLFGGGG
jgi:hypothetical protein